MLIGPRPTAARTEASNGLACVSNRCRVSPTLRIVVGNPTGDAAAELSGGGSLWGVPTHAVEINEDVTHASSA